MTLILNKSDFSLPETGQHGFPELVLYQVVVEVDHLDENEEGSVWWSLGFTALHHYSKQNVHYYRFAQIALV